MKYFEKDIARVIETYVAPVKEYADRKGFLFDLSYRVYSPEGEISLAEIDNVSFDTRFESKHWKNDSYAPEVSIDLDKKETGVFTLNFEVEFPDVDTSALPYGTTITDIVNHYKEYVDVLDYAKVKLGEINVENLLWLDQVKDGQSIPEFFEEDNKDLDEVIEL